MRAGPAWLEDVWVRTQLSPDFRQATVLVRVQAKGAASEDAMGLGRSRRDDRAKGNAEAAAEETEISIPLAEPQLWWPRTHGKPSLYRLQVALLDGERQLDQQTVLVGVRDIRPVLRDPATGEPRFRFDINGRPIFLRGADWAPLEGMTHCWNQERAVRLLDLMEHGRMNVLRIWGEGNIPPAEFYDECDRRGILVWQDFMFGYGLHPTGDAAFDENCRLEIEGMIRGLRNHPSIFLWVGGNENHMGWDFAHGTQPTAGTGVFDRIMPEALPGSIRRGCSIPVRPTGAACPTGRWKATGTITRR